MTAKIGIMGGTFDPIHNGHLEVAKSVAAQLGLERVLFIPTGNPHFKLDKKVTDAHTRAQMVELAIAGCPDFEIDMCEVERPGVTYTADTLEELTERNPKAVFYFIMGADSAKTLVHWRRAQRVAELCRIVVVQRPGESAEETERAFENSTFHIDALFVDVPQVDVSSTEIRGRVARRESIANLVPASVADYIEQAGLYKE